MSANIDKNRKFNLSDAHVALVAATWESLGVLAPMVSAFGVTNLVKCASVDEARTLFAVRGFHLIIVDYHLDSGDGFGFVEWVRRSACAQTKIAPTLFVSANYTLSAVKRARDAGVNFVIAKPVTSEALLSRVLWVADNQRQFVECEAYVGPDRRFRFEGPPLGIPGRRKDDLGMKLGQAKMPNMSQDSIDDMFKPRKLAL